MLAAAEIQRGSQRLGRYLRKLRLAYGYTLRHVEEHSSSLGSAIDNSQLSRFEKGKAVPSFDKLRVLARMFNVPVQTFSDILDLQEYDALKPAAANPETLFQQGLAAYERGEYGRSYVVFERLAEVSLPPDGAVQAENLARARYHMAVSLKRMGRLAMAESDLRQLLQEPEGQYPLSLRVRALLQLAFVYREQGDLYLASVIARDCHLRAVEGADEDTVAASLNTAGIIEEELGHFQEAAEHFRAALAVLRPVAQKSLMRLTVQANLGGVLSATGRFKTGVALLKQVLSRAKEGRYRRVIALTLTKLATAYDRRHQERLAREYIRKSNQIAGKGTEPYHDILFINTYLNWQMARTARQSTQERIHFGRLKYLRALLESRFLEVNTFDAIVREEGRYV
ncbi:MAG: tetratricopeptide repeat protein [Acidobacteriota bacterium]